MFDNPLFLAYYLPSLLIGFALHEAAHAYSADYLGDKTSRMMGRLTLNPLKHLDPFGSVVLPLLLILAGSPFIFAAAKPVPVNPQNFKRPYMDFAIVALAGPMANILLAIFGALTLRFLDPASGAFAFFIIFIWANMVLAFFNLLPIPPLDGSKVLAGFLPRAWASKIFELDAVGFLILMGVVLLGSFAGIPIISTWIGWLMTAFLPILQQVSGLPLFA